MGGAVSAALDSRALRQARARALASAVLQEGPLLNRFQGPLTGIRPAARRRAHRSQPVTPITPREPRGRKTLAKWILGVQCAALLAALWLPAFHATQITVSGADVLSRDAVISTAGLQGQSIFTIDSSTVRSRLVSLPWIRDAAVYTSLPNKVNIRITEWSPTLRMLHGSSDLLLADDGAVVDAGLARHTALATIPILLDSRPGSHEVPPADLVAKLDETVARYPAVFGVSVAAFEWQGDGRFAIWSKSGWKAILGHLDTTAQRASIPEKLAYLAALKGTVDFVSPDFGYIDLESPTTPTVGGTPGLPQAITDALKQASIPLQPPPAKSPASHATTKAATSSKQVTLSIAPAPSSAPPQASSAPATPTPYTFYLPPPSGKSTN